MDTSEWIATLALIVSSGALFLELRRWHESGAKLHLSVIADVPFFPGKARLSLAVTNRGDAPTTITHMVAFFYRNWFMYLLDRHDEAFFVAQSAGSFGMSGAPARVSVNGVWHGTMPYTDRSQDARRKGRLYVGVVASHSSRRFLVKVPREPAAVPETELGSE